MNDTSSQGASTIKEKPRRTKKPFLWAFFLILMCGLVAFGGAWLAVKLATPHAGLDEVITQQEDTVARVVEQVSPSVVSVVTAEFTPDDEYYEYYEGAGTGVIVSADGYVITNNHVIDGASEVRVVTSDGTAYDNVTVIGRDPLNDIAFIKIEATTTFIPAQLGDSGRLRVGQQVIAFGNALGQYQNTVTSGIVSGIGRPVVAANDDGSDPESLVDLIQTDAAINSGNSGGPLVDREGRVIGINTAFADANMIGFAIPINATKGMIEGVIQTGKIQKSYLGVRYIDLTVADADEYQLPVARGAYLVADGAKSALQKNGPADQAGLREGDIIMRVNDDAVGEQGGLSSIIGQYMPGERVMLEVLRDNEVIRLEAELGNYARS